MKREMEELAFESLLEDSLERIASGQPLIQTIEHDPREPNYARMLAWIHRDPERKIRYHEAQEMGAEVIAQQLITLSDASDSMEDVSRSTLRINTRKWLLGVWSRKRFGDTQQVEQTINVNFVDAMRTARERVDRMRTVDASGVVDVPVRLTNAK